MKSRFSGAVRLSVVLLSLQTLVSAQAMGKRPVLPRPRSIQLQSPVAGQTVSGTLRLALSGDLSQVASVRYRLGDYLVAVSTQLPFAASWNSALAADGNVQIEAIAYDLFGKVLADTFTPVTFSNYGNRADVTPVGASSKLSGSVTFRLHGFDSVHDPAYWTTAIDGDAQTPTYTDHGAVHDNNSSQTFDTTAYPNGKREFYFTFHSNDYNNPNPPPGSQNFRGMVMQYLDFDNGRSFMEVVANYLHVYTLPGGTIALGCTRAYTNGDREACTAPQWVPSDSAVAAVDSTGNLRALKEGYTDVTLTEGGRATYVRVWVRNDPGLPHFTTNGGISTAYVDGKSTFMVAPFQLNTDYLSTDPNLVTEVRRAGINTLTQGMYINPLDLNTTFASWLSSFNGLILPGLQWAAANGFRILGGGDNVARNIGSEAYRTLNWPQAKAAVQYAFQQFAQSGAGVAVEMIDEAAFLWGPGPNPPGLLGAANSMQSIFCVASTCTVNWPNLADNSFHDTISTGLTFSIAGNPALNSPAGTTYTVQNATADSFTFKPATPLTANFTPQTDPSTEFEWFARATTCSGSPCQPPVPNSALSTISSWVKTASPTVPISFPAGGVVLPPGQRNWIGKGSLSDYASHFWDTVQLRPTYVFGKGIHESGYSMLNSFYARQQYMQLSKPQTILIGASDHAYLKNSPPGTDGYNPPVDQLLNTGVIPKAVSSTMLAAAAAGCVGLRIYQFESPDDYKAQVAAGPGGGYQTAAAPTYGAVNLWRSMGYAGALITKVLQPYLLSQPLSSPAYGRNIVTGVRKSSAGIMLMVVNAWDGPRPINVDFTPWKSGFGATRYRVSDTYIKTAVLSDSAAETIALDSGEAVIYIFPNSNATTGIDIVSFAPVSPGGVSKYAISVGYLYQQNVAAFGDTFDCSNGCAIPIDRRLGEVFFQSTILDSSSNSIRAGTVQPLGKANSIRIPAVPLVVGQIHSVK